MKTKNVRNAVNLFNSNRNINKQISYRPYKDGDKAIISITTDVGYSKGWTIGGNNTYFEFNIFKRKTPKRIFFENGNSIKDSKFILAGKEKDLREFQNFVVELEKLGY